MTYIILFFLIDSEGDCVSLNDIYVETRAHTYMHKDIMHTHTHTHAHTHTPTHTHTHTHTHSRRHVRRRVSLTLPVLQSVPSFSGSGVFLTYPVLESVLSFDGRGVYLNRPALVCTEFLLHAS